MAKTISKLLGFLIFLLVHLQISYVAALVTFRNETDKLALVAFKDRITQDPLSVMSSWNNSLHHCAWVGISCSKTHRGRVTVLNLRGRQLAGSIPPHIGNLSFLRAFGLKNNSFIGVIPQEIGRLFRLIVLDLSNNAFEGEIPSNLSHCSHLEGINFNTNKLIGNIPVELSSLSTKLTDFLVSQNNLTGVIPRWLGNASLLIQLSMQRNSLHGSIPPELGRLSELTLLTLSQNHLSGTVPPPIYNLSSLKGLDLALNQLQGQLPPDLGLNLPNLERLYNSRNEFTGPIPVSLPNASRLERVSFGFNNFIGALPLAMGSLTSLELGAFSGNQLESIGFITALTNCSNLRTLDVGSNNFKGQLPASIGNLSAKLEYLALDTNQIKGTIPEGIEHLASLTWFGLDYNAITGEIPTSIGTLGRLVYLSLSHNRISGIIPSSLGNITGLSRLYLQENDLDGSIPPSLGSCQHLELLDLSANNLTGAIPKEVSISSLTITFNLSRNSLTGPFPREVGNMTMLLEMDVSQNRLSGEIPSTISNCLMLEGLRMNDNLFEGRIPSSFDTLKSLSVLDLSRNNISGQIPVYLQNNTYLQNLNLSFNNLDGEVPREGVFKNASAFSVVGNWKLCGGIESLGLPACQIPVRKKKRKSLALKVATPVSISCLILLASLFATLYWIKKPARKPSTMLLVNEQFPQISYAELLRATNGFSSFNLLGEGSYGSVYKGTLTDGMIVAVKVFNLKRKGASKSFMAECRALRNIRHRNLLKIVTACSSIDSKGDDFKAIVSEFMPNRSLQDWLHPSEDEQLHNRYLSLAQRLSITMDVASAVEYLHHRGQTSIIHGDLKPSNVLLDHDMDAHVGDFGLARFLPDRVDTDSSQNQTSSSSVKGTVGYVAPEYGIGGNASMQGDVFSFGILLLEMFTGRRPTDGMFKDGLTLHSFTKMALPERVMMTVEASLLLEGGDNNDVENNNRSMREMSKIEECLLGVLKIGVSCSMESPGERMDMKDVVAEMHKITKLFGTRI